MPSEHAKCPPSRLHFVPVRCPLSLESSSAPLSLHSGAIWAVCGFSQKFSHFAEPPGASGLSRAGWRSSKAGLSWEISSTPCFQPSWQETK